MARMAPKRTAAVVGRRIGVNFKKVPCDQFRRGLVVEGEEHRNVTHGSTTTAGKIAHAHLKELPTYYTELARMEKRAKK